MGMASNHLDDIDADVLDADTQTTMDIYAE